MLPAPIHVVHAVSSPTSPVVIAVIALVATIVGALISTGSQLWIAARQAKRDQAERRTELVTAARMMNVDLARGRSNLQYCIDYGEWWRVTGLSPRLSPEDRRLVIGALTPRGFYNVDRAEAAIDHWYGIREHEIAKRREMTGPDWHGNLYDTATITSQTGKLKEIIGWIDQAGASLREITDDPVSIDQTTEPNVPTEDDAATTEVPDSSDIQR